MSIAPSTPAQRHGLLEAVERSMRTGLAAVDEQGVQTYVNPAFCAMVGWSEGELLGQRAPFVYWPPEETAAIEHALSETVSGRASTDGFELAFMRKSGERIRVRLQVSPLLDDGNVEIGFLASVTDITRREREQRRARVLDRATASLLKGTQGQEGLARLAFAVVPDLADWCTLYVPGDEGHIRPLVVAHEDESRARAALAHLEANPIPATMTWGVAHVLRTGQSEILNGSNPDIAEALRGVGLVAHVAVPLRTDGRVVGCLALANTTSQRMFDGDDLAAAEELAIRASLALERSQLIDQVKSAADASARAHATFEALFESTPAAIMMLDLDGTVRLWNEAAEQTFGWTRDEAIGQFLPAVDPSRRDELTENLARVGGGARIIAAEATRRRKNGETFSAQLFGSPVRTPDGSIQCMSVVLDISERKLEELRQQFLHQASAVMASSLALSAVFDRLVDLAVPGLADWCFIDRLENDGSLQRAAIAHADPSLTSLAQRLRRRLARRQHEAAVHYGLSTVISGGCGQLVTDVPDELLRSVAADDDHLDALRAMRLRSFISAPLLLAGRPIGAFTMCSATRRYDARDLAMVEDLARRAGALLETAQLYEQTRELLGRIERLQAATAELSRATTTAEVARTIVLNGARAVGAEACVVWLQGPDGALRMVEQTGVPNDYLGDWEHIRTDSGAPGLRVVETGIPEWIETADDYRVSAPGVYDRVAPDGKLRAFAALPLAFAGARRGLLTFSFPLGRRFLPDEKQYMLTLARQCQQALDRAELFANEASARADAELAQAQAEAANRAKDEFLAMLGHELRNPIAPIVTALELLDMRGAGTTREHAIIGRQVQHLMRLVDDLLDLSRVTRGKVELTKTVLAVAQLVSRAVEIARPLVEQRRHRLHVDVAEDICVVGDVTRLTQVVTNLITNAAKYTPKGGDIWISAESTPDVIRIRVRDNGIGIDPPLLPHVFDAFTQGPRAIDRAEGGLGIGLALVKNFVDLHHGRVEVTSDGAGRGSEFVVSLPASATAVSATTFVGPHDASAQIKRRVLITDDNRDAAEMLAEMLRASGHDVVVAYDGPQAIAAFDRFSPDVAILDIGLPVMDGYELATHLRQHRNGPHVKIVALTGYGQERDRSRSTSAGFDAHLVKPVSPDVLRRYIEE